MNCQAFFEKYFTKYEKIYCFLKKMCYNVVKRVMYMKDTKTIISENLLFYRKKNNMSQKELADLIGVKHNTISSWEKGTNTIDIDSLFKISKILNVDISTMFGASSQNLTYEETELIKNYNNLDKYGKRMVDMTMTEQLYRVEQQKESIKEITTIDEPITYHIPYYDMPVSAGTGQYLDYTNCSVMSLKSEPPANADFVLSVSGDSMEPTFFDGDKVFVQEAQALNLGDIGIFYYDGDVYIKEYGEEGLISHNKKYKLIRGNENIRILGKVVGTVEE